jgi:hypothetical protein
MSNLGASDVDARLEELLIDGVLYAFQEQVRSAGCLGCLLRVLPHHKEGHVQRNF